MKIKFASYLTLRLINLGITEVFGLPGDYNFKIVEAIEENKDINWIGSTNELNAGYAADGYSRIKGFGAMVSTFGVGELSAINAIAGSMAENVPVIKIVGVPKTKDIENCTLLHHNLDNANYHAFEHAYSNVVETTAFLNKQNAKDELDRVIDVMIKTKKPVYVAVPIDVCDVEVEIEYKKLVLKSDAANLKLAVEEIIALVEKSTTPLLIAGILANRFDAKKVLNDFLSKTKIPSCSFIRGMDIVNSDTKNYMGVYSAELANKVCYDYMNLSDCIILAGCVLSDLNTMGFKYNFKLNDVIDIHFDYVSIKGKKIENVLIKDLFEALKEKISYIYGENITNELGYKNLPVADNSRLCMEYIYPRIEKFLKEDDILVTEVGLVPFGAIPMKFPSNISVQNQMLWGSIGWATPCAFGCSMADRSRRTILITGDGSHQLTAQEISTMMRNKVKPIIFVINNSGYTVERILCDNVDYDYNNIASWNYSMLPKVFKGECFTAKIKTNKEFDEILNVVEKEQKERMCYIELITDYLDIPSLAMNIVKYPEQLNK